jgi:hypothetical protein
MAELLLKNKEAHPVFFQKIDGVKASFGLTPEILDEWIKIGKIKEGIHFVKPNSRLRLFNVALMEDRIVNWDDDPAHEQGILNYSRSLPSGKSKGSR